MIKAIRQALISSTGLPIKPIYTDTLDDQIVYKHYPINDNGAKSIQSLEIRLITNTYSEAERLRKLIIEALVPVGDNVLIDGITGCELVGGSSPLYEGETKTYHTLLYFQYIQKSENGGVKE